MATPSAVDTVAIIGAGASGLAAARYLQSEGAFSTITVFEQRGTVAGIWNATPDITGDDDGTHEVAGVDGEARFPSPIYDDLESNLPHSLMRFSDLPFPDGVALFPHHKVIRQYLYRYAHAVDVHRLVRLGVQVLAVRQVDEPARGRGRWAVTVRDLRTRDESTMLFDAVIVASGNFHTPFVPDISGIREWRKAYPEAILHSMSYRRPSVYRDKKVVVVGNFASGIDIAEQIASVSQQVLLSERDATRRFVRSIGSWLAVPEIAQFIVQDRAIHFTDGRVERHVDHVVFCTGYRYAFPFLQGLEPPAATPGSLRVQNIYQHIFYSPQPTLAFVGLLRQVVPFAAAEGQAAVIARVLSGRLRLPSTREMQDWEAGVIARGGAGLKFHTFGFPGDVEYINFLHAWSSQAAPNPGDKDPPLWDDEMRWLRSLTHDLNSSIKKLGLPRSTVYTLTQLGFDWETAWRGAGDTSGCRKVSDT